MCVISLFDAQFLKQLDSYLRLRLTGRKRTLQITAQTQPASELIIIITKLTFK